MLQLLWTTVTWVRLIQAAQAGGHVELLPTWESKGKEQPLGNLESKAVLKLNYNT